MSILPNKFDGGKGRKRKVFMAGWQDLEAYIKLKYNATNTEVDGYYTINLTSNNEVVGKALVTQADSDDKWAYIIAQMEEIKNVNLDTMFENLWRIPCGGVVKVGNFYYLRHSVFLEPFSEGVFDNSLAAVLVWAKFVTGQL